MHPTLVLQAFGELSPDTASAGVDSVEEDLYSVFNARAEMMGWSMTNSMTTTIDGRGRTTRSTVTPRPPYRLLWGMNEAELTPEAKGAQIGWVQVGLKDGIANPAVVLPPLVQCFDDALRRFGALELSSLQVVAFDLEPGHGTLEDGVADRGTPGENFFNLGSKSKVEAVVAFDQEMFGGHTVADMQYVGYDWQPVPVPDGDQIHWPADMRGTLTPSDLGLSVSLPEWTAGSVGRELGLVIRATHDLAQDARNFAVRITRNG